MRRGDDAAFGVLFERYRRRLIAFAARTVGDYGRAEDLIQDVFISALRRLKATDAPIAFRPWIYEIARNACIDSFRRSRPDEVSLDAQEGAAAAVVARLANAAPDPVAALDDKERLADLCGAVGGLSESERDTLVMRELDGCSYREIGERLQMRRSAVESTLFRARRKLALEYEDLRNGDRCRRVQGIVAAEAADTGARGPGLRDARRLARHVSHCQPCRRAALAAGVAVGPADPRPRRSRVAGLLPLPAFLRPEGGALASLACHAEPAVAWVKALAAAATVTAVGLGAGVAVEEGAGVPLRAGGPQPLIERATGAGPGETGWFGGAQAARGALGADSASREAGAPGAPGVRGIREAAGAQGREGPGRDRATFDEATGRGPGDDGAPATGPAAGERPRGAGPGAGRGPTGGSVVPPSRPGPGDTTRPGGPESSTPGGVSPPPPTHVGARPEVPNEPPGKVLIPAGGGPPEPPAPGGLPDGDASSGPQASAPARPRATVNSAIDITPQASAPTELSATVDSYGDSALLAATATAPGVPDAPLPSRAPAVL